MKKIILRLLITILVLFCLFAVGLYFAFSSPYFIKSYLFPALTNATGVKISAEEVYLSHHSTEIRLENYSIEFSQDFAIDGKFASFKYDFWNLIKGKINIYDLVLNNARVNIKTKDREVKAKQAHKLKGANTEIVKKKSSSGFDVNIKNIVINDSELQYSYISSNSKKSINIHLNDINILVPELGTNKSSKVKFNFSLGLRNQDYYKIGVEHVKGNLDFTTENLNILSFNLSTYFNEISGSNKSEKFDNKNLLLDLRINKSGVDYIVDKFVLNDFSKNDQNLLNLNLRGKFSIAPLNLITKISSLNISPNVLNVIGSFWELNFGKTNINYSGSFCCTGANVGFDGNLKLSEFSFFRSHFNCLGNHTIDLNALGNLSYNYVNGSYKTDKLNLVINEKNNEILNLDIDNPASLIWKNENPVFLDNSFTGISVKTRDFDLSILESIFCRYFSIQQLKGILNSNLILTSESEKKVLLKGNIDLSEGGAVYDKLRFKKINFKQSFDLLIKSFNELLINNLKTTIKADSALALKFSTEGYINFSQEKGDLKIKFDKITGRGVNNLPGSPAEMLAIKDVNIDGFIDYAYTKGGSDFSIKSKLQGGGLKFFLKKGFPIIPILSGNMEVYIVKKGSELELKKYICNLYMPDRKFGNLAADGKIFLYGPGNSKLNLYSEGIRLKELITAFNSIAGSFNINFDDMRFDTKLVLKDITFGPYLTFDCESEIDINNGVINADPIFILMNGKPVLGKIVYNFKEKENNAFDFAANASNIDLKPILKTFDSKAYSNSKGEISSFSMNIHGEGFSRIDLEKNLKGNLYFTCKDISLPDNPERNNYIRLLFIPIEVIAQMNELFGNVNLPIFFTDLVKYSKDIFSQMKNLDLKYGVVYVVAKNEKIFFKQCVFKGNGNPISWLKFKGSLGFDKSVNLISRMKLNDYFIVPLHISGTVKDPKPDMLDFMRFIEEQTYESIKSGTQEVLWLPDTIFEKMCYDADIFFQSIVP